jgi:hypothetical protein
VNCWPLIDFPIPIRFPNYQFTTHDYAVYLRDRESLLLQPKGRAALLQGGIVWRLALETVGMEAALEGPSSDVTNCRLRISFSSGDPESGVQYWDDELTNDELIMLCGGYKFYTGMSCYFCLKGRTHVLQERESRQRANLGGLCSLRGMTLAVATTGAIGLIGTRTGISSATRRSKRVLPNLTPLANGAVYVRV